MEKVLVKNYPADSLVQFTGIVDLEPGGRFGQLVPLDANGRKCIEYPYLSKDFIHRFRLKKGMELDALILPRTDFSQSQSNGNSQYRWIEPRTTRFCAPIRRPDYGYAGSVAESGDCQW